MQILSDVSVALTHFYEEIPDRAGSPEPSDLSTPRLALITSIPFVLYAVIQNILTSQY